MLSSSLGDCMLIFSKAHVRFFWTRKILLKPKLLRSNYGCSRNLSSGREIFSFFPLNCTSNYIILDILRLINNLLVQHEIFRDEVSFAVKGPHFSSWNSEFSSFYITLNISLESKVHVTSNAAEIPSKCIQACGLACYRDKAVCEGQSWDLRDEILLKQTKK